MNTTTAANPLAQTLFEAQRIVYEAAVPSANTRVAIERLKQLLCTPGVTAALMNAGIAAPTL
jgi:hypothetical protein